MGLSTTPFLWPLNVDPPHTVGEAVSPMTCDLWPLTGEAYMRLNRLEEAGHWYRESLRAKPDHIPAHLTYGKLLSIIVSPSSTNLFKARQFLTFFYNRTRQRITQKLEMHWCEYSVISVFSLQYQPIQTFLFHLMSFFTILVQIQTKCLCS